MTKILYLISLFLHAFEDSFLFIALIAGSALCLGFIRRSHGLSFFLSICFTFALTHIIKSICKIPRPEDALEIARGYRFPSMHSAIAGAFLTSIAWHIYFSTKSKVVRISVAIITLTLISFIAWTRLFLGVHELIDVVTGAVLGITISLAIHAIIKKYGLE